MPIRSPRHWAQSLLHRWRCLNPRYYALVRLIREYPEEIPYLISTILHRLDARIGSEYDRLNGLLWGEHWHQVEPIARVHLFAQASSLKPYTIVRALWTLGYPDLATQHAQWLHQLGLEDPRHG
jgi:hypothetical protein